MKYSQDVLKAFELAKEAQQNSYSPYSNFKVGAALKLKGEDEYYQGCNVENASIGATVCAERSSIQTCIAESGRTDFEFIVIVSSTDPAIGPCGLCLQVLSEFVEPGFPVYLANHNEIQKVIEFKDLIHKPFSKIPKQI